MLKYELEEYEAMTEAQKDAKKHGYVLRRYDLKTSRLWRRFLIGNIGANMECKVVRHSGDNRVQILGQPANIDAVITMYEYIWPQLERMCVHYHHTHVLLANARGTKAFSLLAFQQGFYMGAVDKITERLEEQAEMLKRSDANMTAMIVYNERALLDVATETWGRIRKAKLSRAGVGDPTAYAAGIVAAGHVQFNITVRGGERPE
jgi:hypothetical protein